MRLIGSEMDQPQAADFNGRLLAKGVKPSPRRAARRERPRREPSATAIRASRWARCRTAAAKVLRGALPSERPLNASEVARAAGLHRGTAYNILRTLQVEGFVAGTTRRRPAAIR